MPGNPFKKPARPKISARVKKPARPGAASRSAARSQMPGVASGSGLSLKSTPIRAAKVNSTPKSGGVKRMPAPRQGAQLGTPGRTGSRPGAKYE